MDSLSFSASRDNCSSHQESRICENVLQQFRPEAVSCTVCKDCHLDVSLAPLIWTTTDLVLGDTCPGCLTHELLMIMILVSAYSCITAYKAQTNSQNESPVIRSSAAWGHQGDSSLVRGGCAEFAGPGRRRAVCEVLNPTAAPDALTL